MIVEIAAALAILCIISLFLKNKPWQHLPPSPMALPIIGHFHLLGPLLHQSLRDLSSRYGPLMYLQLGSVSCVVISSPELAKEALKINELAFANRITSLAIDHLSYGSSFSFAPFGPYWKFIKKVSTFELLSSRTLSQLYPIRKNELRQFLRAVSGKAKACESVNVAQELLKLSNNIISQMMLSIRCSGIEGQGDKEEDVRTLVREVTQIFGEFNVSDFVWFCRKLDLQGFRRRFEDTHRRFDALLEKIITEHEMERKEKQMKKKSEKANAAGNDSEEVEVIDFLDMMLDLMEDQNAEMQLTREQIKALILDFLTAGTDTTATGTEWALSELINHPEMLRKARQEVDDVVGNTRLVEESDVCNLPYIQAIVKETLRLHPPVPMVTRKSVQTCNINGFTVPANALLFVNVWAIGRDPKHWENPLEFEPRRFWEKSADGGVDVRGNHFQLLPFGSGRRSCPGLSLAMLELHTTLAAMIQCFEWDRVVGPDGEIMKGEVHVDMDERPGLTVPKARDLVCKPLLRPIVFDL